MYTLATATALGVFVCLRRQCAATSFLGHVLFYSSGMVAVYTTVQNSAVPGAGTAMFEHIYTIDLEACCAEPNRAGTVLCVSVNAVLVTLIL